MFLTGGEAVLALRQAVRKNEEATGKGSLERGRRERGTPSSTVLRVKLVGAQRPVAVRGEEELAGKSNYFIGNDPAKWRTDVANYGRVRYEGVYRGVDLVYYGHEGELESDFVVAPGTDAGVIRLEMAGAKGVRINGQGDLEMETEGGEVVLERPAVYQRRMGKGGSGGDTAKNLIPARYVANGEREVGFAVGKYNTREPLIIDPVLRYSTYLGGNGDDIGYGIAVDTSGNAYVTGATDSPNFPTANALQGTNSGSGAEAFLTKLNAAGSALVYSTYLDWTTPDGVHGIAVDAAGNVYVTGDTNSTNFRTKNAFQGTLGGGDDAFIAKIFVPAAAGDFDGDGRADHAVWRPSLGDWFLIPSITPTSCSNGAPWETFRYPEITMVTGSWT